MKNIYTLKRPTVAIITAMCLSLTSTIAIADVDKGLVAYNRHDYATALKEFKESANQGDAEAQYKLGLIYDNGQGVLKNESIAVDWWQKSADQGHTDAQTQLGMMYVLGNGVIQNIQTAYFWWLIASANGNQDAKTVIEVAEKRLTPKQKQAAQGDAARWRPKIQ